MQIELLFSVIFCPLECTYDLNSTLNGTSRFRYKFFENVGELVYSRNEQQA